MCRFLSGGLEEIKLMKMKPVFEFGDDEGHEVRGHGHGLLVMVPNVLVSSFPKNKQDNIFNDVIKLKL